MTIAKFKELLNQYPEETHIKIFNNMTCERNNIDIVTIEYVTEDDYSMPEIILCVDPTKEGNQ